LFKKNYFYFKTYFIFSIFLQTDVPEIAVTIAEFVYKMARPVDLPASALRDGRAQIVQS
jgi:hypothetical protein